MSTIDKPRQKIKNQDSRSSVIGQFRRMGPYGPVYEVIAVAGPNTLTIRELESGRETSDYSIEHFNNDLHVA